MEEGRREREKVTKNEIVYRDRAAPISYLLCALYVSHKEVKGQNGPRHMHNTPVRGEAWLTSWSWEERDSSVSLSSSAQSPSEASLWWPDTCLLT